MKNNITRKYRTKKCFYLPRNGEMIADDKVFVQCNTGESESYFCKSTPNDGNNYRLFKKDIDYMGEEFFEDVTEDEDENWVPIGIATENIEIGVQVVWNARTSEVKKRVSI